MVADPSQAEILRKIAKRTGEVAAQQDRIDRALMPTFRTARGLQALGSAPTGETRLLPNTGTAIGSQVRPEVVPGRTVGDFVPKVEGEEEETPKVLNLAHIIASQDFLAGRTWYLVDKTGVAKELYTEKGQYFGANPAWALSALKDTEPVEPAIEGSIAASNGLIAFSINASGEPLKEAYRFDIEDFPSDLLIEVWPSNYTLTIITYRQTPQSFTSQTRVFVSNDLYQDADQGGTKQQPATYQGTIHENLIDIGLLMRITESSLDPSTTTFTFDIDSEPEGPGFELPGGGTGVYTRDTIGEGRRGPVDLHYEGVTYDYSRRNLTIEVDSAGGTGPEGNGIFGVTSGTILIRIVPIPRVEVFRSQISVLMLGYDRIASYLRETQRSEFLYPEPVPKKLGIFQASSYSFLEIESFSTEIIANSGRQSNFLSSKTFVNAPLTSGVLPEMFEDPFSTEIIIVKIGPGGFPSFTFSEFLFPRISLSQVGLTPDDIEVIFWSAAVFPIPF